MKKVLLIILFSLVTAMLFCEEYKSIEYNGTGYPASTSTPTLSVELNRDGNTLGFGFSSTDPKSTSGITNITEMPLSLSSELNSETGKITLIGRTSFYIWWQIQLPIESGKKGYSFSVKKGENLGNGTYSIPYTIKKTDNTEISTTFFELDKYTSYNETTIYSNSFMVNVVSSDASGVPYGTLLSSTITLEVTTI